MRKCGVRLAVGTCAYDTWRGREACYWHEVLMEGLTQDSYGKWWGEPWRPGPVETNGDRWRPADALGQLLWRWDSFPQNSPTP